VLGNSRAQLSHINLRSPSEGSDDEDVYEIVNGGGSAGVRENGERNNSGTLSAKAGIILVCVHFCFRSIGVVWASRRMLMSCLK
jgi:hypothetical protein